MTFNILSCDGGGIRGFLSARIMQDLQAKTGFLDHVDGFAGTSTGGLIAIALADGRAQGKDMTKLIDTIVGIYRHDAGKIFKELTTTKFGTAVEDLLEALGLAGGAGILSAQYSPDGVHDIANSLVQDRTFGSIPQDLVLAVNTAALAMQLPPDARDPAKPDLRNWGPVTLSNHAVGNAFGQDTLGLKLRDGALATSAAPTYFPPHSIEISAGHSMYFADGGTFANNPVMNAVEIALASDSKRHIGDLQILSVGTGLQPLAITNADANDWGPDYYGVLEWFGAGEIAPTAGLLELTLSASAENQTRIAQALFKDNLVRLNPFVPASIKLDSTDSAIFGVMNNVVAAMHSKTPWSQACKMLAGWAQ
ncbi:patatin-like phospholipase family protein [uncultured Tateyamaria sp.]|uniref:patatin-like phospholipase family protein n=1 Tax=Tateyamaria sp. 1078 TaxID=3417464 RepID=UPI0026352055|nr:patatin-like phospholipase family protein [uncultured Tateyamaria sp.]